MTRPDLLARRARIARWVAAGKRLGYGLYLAAVILFAVGLAAGFERWMTSSIVAALVVGSLVLAPAIVFGYAVRAAEREDREREAAARLARGSSAGNDRRRPP